MIKSWIIALRRKPKAARDRAAFMVAAGFATLIGVGWVATLPFRFADTALQPANLFGGLTDVVSSELADLSTELPEISTSTPTQAATTTQSGPVLEWVEITPASSTRPDPVTPSTTERVVRIATTSTTATGTVSTP